MPGQLIVHVPVTASADAAYLYRQTLTTEGAERVLEEAAKAYLNRTIPVEQLVREIVPLVKEALGDGPWGQDTLEYRAWKWLYDAANRLEAELELTDFVGAQQARLRSDTSPRLLAALGLDPATPLDQEIVRRLFAGHTATDTMIDGKRQRVDGVSWLEVPFAPPKPVSLLYAFADPGPKSEILAAHMDAVDAAMRVVEKAVGVMRTNERGLTHERGDVTWIQFVDTTSRRGQPQLHSHVALLNTATSQTTDRVGVVDGYKLRQLDSHQVYVAQMVTRLRDLGYTIDYDREQRRLSIPGIPDEVCRAFSGRRSNILEQARAYLARDDVELDGLTRTQRTNLLRIGAVIDRPPPAKPDPDEWRKIAAALGWEPAIVYAARHPVKARDQPEPAAEKRSAAGFVDPEYHRGQTEQDWDLAR